MADNTVGMNGFIPRFRKSLPQRAHHYRTKPVANAGFTAGAGGRRPVGALRQKSMQK